MDQKSSTELTVERQCSFELSRGANGKYSYKLKSYQETLSRAIENVFAEKAIVEELLKEKASPPKDGPASQ